MNKATTVPMVRALQLAQEQCRVEVIHFGKDPTADDKILRSVLTNDYEPRAILEYLFDNDEELSKFSSFYVVHPNGYFPVDKEQFIQGILTSSVLNGPEKTICYLEKLLKDKTIDIVYIAVISGLEPEEEFHFKHSKFISFKDLPDSPYKELFLSMIDKEHSWGMGGLLPHPSSALMSSTSYGKIILTETKEISGRKFPIAPKEIQNKIPRCFAQEEHNEILLSLSGVSEINGAAGRKPAKNKGLASSPQ